MRKILCLLLSAVLLLGLCACNADEQTRDVPPELTLPDLIYGTWYPQPDVSNQQIVIYEDGTCVVDGQQWNWKTKSITEAVAVLTAGEGEEEFDIEFKYLNTNVPVLAEKHFGWSVKDPKLWDYAIEWYNEEADTAFSLTLFALTQTECNIRLEAEKMTVEVLAGEWASYVLELTAEQAVVTAPDGKSTTYFPAPDGMGTP